MYHRVIGEGEKAESVAAIAEKLRLVLTRAIVLLVVLIAAPYLYGVMTGGSLDHLAGADTTTWETMQWALMMALVFMIIGLVGIARVRAPRRASGEAP